MNQVAGLGWGARGISDHEVSVKGVVQPVTIPGLVRQGLAWRRQVQMRQCLRGCVKRHCFLTAAGLIAAIARCVQTVLHLEGIRV
jgi:hypothetical protein